MKFPVRFEYDGQSLESFTVREIIADHMASVSNLVNRGLIYTGMRKWATSVLESIDDIEDRTKLENIVKVMPFVDLYAVICFGLVETRGEDSVEASYKCPKCGTIRTYIKTEDDDMTDHLLEMEYEQVDDEPLTFHFDKKVSILKPSGEPILELESIQMRMPNIEDFIRGEQRYPDDTFRLMFFAYGCALQTVDHKEVDQKFRNKFGEMVFSKMSSNQINKVSKRVYRDQIGNNMERVCLKCHHRWEAPLNLSGFFNSGVQEQS
jgi:hypothetical protein